MFFPEIPLTRIYPYKCFFFFPVGRGLNSMFEIIELVTNDWACWARIIVDYIDSAAFVVPVIIFLM